MKFFHQAVLLLLFLGYSTGKDLPVSDDIQNLDSIERIVGGKTARHGAYPWVVSVHVKLASGSSVHGCGGVILNENWIVTAAHCILQNIPVWRYEVIVGMHNRATKHSPSLRRHTVSKILLHKGFDKRYRNDIALMKMTKPIDVKGSNGFVSPINLPEPGTEPTGDAKVIGWGHTVDGGKLSDKLLEVTVPVVSRDRCRALWHKDIVSEDMICAAATTMGGSCVGDSGGPLFQTKESVSTLIGIVSFGGPCGSKDFPGVYTKVSSFLNWIEGAMKE